MKILYKITLVIWFVFFTGVSCESTSSERCNRIYCEKWSLIQIIQGFAEPEIFAENEIVWKFTSDSILTIQINTDLTDKSINPFSNGEYNYYLSQETITIDNEIFKYVLTDDTLFISQDVASDGPEFNFKRI